MTADPKQIGRHLHKETQSARMKRDEEDISKVMGVFHHWIDPFETSNELASLGSGRVASESTKQDLLNAKAKGTDNMGK